MKSESFWASFRTEFDRKLSKVGHALILSNKWSVKFLIAFTVFVMSSMKCVSKKVCLLMQYKLCFRIGYDYLFFIFCLFLKHRIIKQKRWLILMRCKSKSSEKVINQITEVDVFVSLSFVLYKWRVVRVLDLYQNSTLLCFYLMITIKWWI